MAAAQDVQEIPAAPSTATTFKPCRNIISASIPSEGTKVKGHLPSDVRWARWPLQKALREVTGPTKTRR